MKSTTTLQLLSSASLKSACLITTRADYTRQRSCSEELRVGTWADGNAPQWGVDVIRARERHHRTLHVNSLRFKLCAGQIDHLWRLNKM